MDLRLVRIAFTIEFLVALIASLDFWREVGGQYHLDLMPWWLKMALSVLSAVCIVRITAASVNGFLARRTLLWAAVLLFVIVAGGMATYYFHLYEPAPDQQDEGDPVPTQWRVERPALSRL